MPVVVLMGALGTGAPNPFAFEGREYPVYWGGAVDALPDEAEIFTLNGGTETELRHALRLPKPARTTHFVFPGYGHSLAQRLARRRALQPIVRAFVNGDTAEATRRIRAEGGITRQRHVRLARRARRAATLREA